jgi:hypothetical protein
MPQKKNNKKKESDEEALRNVEREMAKPRLAKSVRVAAHADPADGNPSKQIAINPAPVKGPRIGASGMLSRTH